jgi:transposase
MIAVGLDIHKDKIFCGIHNGKNFLPVREYSTLTCDIRAMGEYLQQMKADKIAMESTGIYRIAIWNIPEEMGFELILVNPYRIKQMPGRKSDVKDAQWIALLLQKDLLRASLVPDEHIRELRTYSQNMINCKSA